MPLAGKKLGKLTLTVRKLAEVDPDDLIRTIPNDSEATLVRARAEAQQHFDRLPAVEYVKIFMHVTKGQGNVRGERYFCLDAEIDRMFPGHSSMLVETHTREEYLAKKHESPAPVTGRNTETNTGRNTGRTRRRK